MPLEVDGAVPMTGLHVDLGPAGRPRRPFLFCHLEAETLEFLSLTMASRSDLFFAEMTWMTVCMG